MADPGISGGGGYQPSWGSGGFAPGHQTKSGGGGDISPPIPPLDPPLATGARIGEFTPEIMELLVWRRGILKFCTH